MDIIIQHEWENRLGTLGYNFQRQAKSIEDFINMFEDKLSEEDRTMLRRIAHDSRDLSRDIDIVEKRYDENSNRENLSQANS